MKKTCDVIIQMFKTQKEKKQNHRQKCENNGTVHNQNDSFDDQMEWKSNEKCLFNKQQHN